LPQGKLLWEPDEKRIEHANITTYRDWLERNDAHTEGYDGLWRWSVENLEDFWKSIWDYYSVTYEGRYERVLSSREMPEARWFEGARINFAEHVFSGRREGPAVLARSEGGEGTETSWAELERLVGSVAATLSDMGVKEGDRVAAYLPNALEAVVAFLACASLGAVWSSCSPEFGAASVIDRFKQIQPAVLFAVGGYWYGGRWYDREGVLRTILSALPSVKKTIVVRTGSPPRAKGDLEWAEAASRRERLVFHRVPSSHPLWILYSSGTTGLPKPIVQSHAGILLEHLKELSLHNDLRPGDRFFWFTTTGWMMWNYLVGGLLHGAAAVLYDGSPGHPDMNALWELVEDMGVTFMGVSASYISACMKAGVNPGQNHSLSKLTGLGSTGSPLVPEGFEWVYGRVKEDIWLASLSGGTDVCTAFVGGCPTLPVYSGEIQCRCLGAKVEAFDEEGRSVLGKVGELVVTEPMPSMPLYLWGDKDGSKYRQSYFDLYPGLWRHGDWIEVKEGGTCIIYGRSDATIKRKGVRIGTAEIYRSVEALPEVVESLAVDTEGRAGESVMFLFVVPDRRGALGKDLEGKIKEKLRQDLSPRYVPDYVVRVAAVPRTLNGKKLEVPVKRIFAGMKPEAALSRDSLANPESVDEYVGLAGRFRRDGKL